MRFTPENTHTATPRKLVLRTKDDEKIPGNPCSLAEARAAAAQELETDLQVHRILKQVDSEAIPDAQYNVMTSALRVLEYQNGSDDVTLRTIIRELGDIPIEIQEAAKAKLAEDVARNKRRLAMERCFFLSQKFENYYQQGQFRECELFIVEWAERIECEYPVLL